MNDPQSQQLEPFDLVLFGGTGDLAMRKLLPAMYFRCKDAQMPPHWRILCIARGALDEQAFSAFLNQRVRPFISDTEFDLKCWQCFCKRLVYLRLDVNVQGDYKDLMTALEPHAERVRVFYLSTAPGLFVRICEGVAEADLITKNSRVALEKPLGRDSASAVQINDRLAEYFDESQIYRIDHYLGKETVQNLMALRFGNALFEPLWRREMVNDVQITIAEEIGVQGRAGFYDHTGALRDMVQNHLLQLLVITAMEPPVNIQPDSIRDEKIKVLRALRPINKEEVVRSTVRGQYIGGVSAGEKVPGYAEDSDITGSTTETFVAIKAHIDSWRWQGVPFYLRTGKRLAEKCTEIVINFKQVPHSIFNAPEQPNRLTIRLQPEEMIVMSIFAKGRGDAMRLQSVDLDLDFNQIFKKRQMIAYERLLLDIIRGNQTLFNHRDEVTAAWAWIDPIIQAWEELEVVPRPYPAGSWGPPAASALIAKGGHSWSEEV